jgi:hypothetical protein
MLQVLETLHLMCIQTACLIKNASTHNFFIYYPILMNKKKDGFSYFFALSSIANDSQLFF